MVVTNISPEQFISETKRWGITPDSLIRVRMMQKGNHVWCRFAIPRTNETLQTRIPLKRFFEFEFLNLQPIAVPAVWIDIAEELEKINHKLGGLNATIIASDKHNS